MKGKRHIQSFGVFNENLNISDVDDSEKLTMVFGNNNTVFKKFHTDDDFPEDIDFLNCM